MLEYGIKVELARGLAAWAEFECLVLPNGDRVPRGPLRMNRPTAYARADVLTEEARGIAVYFAAPLSPPLR